MRTGKYCFTKKALVLHVSKHVNTNIQNLSIRKGSQWVQSKQLGGVCGVVVWGIPVLFSEYLEISADWRYFR